MALVGISGLWRLDAPPSRQRLDMLLELLLKGPLLALFVPTGAGGSSGSVTARSVLCRIAPPCCGS